jgi:hypothetical protein
MKFLSTGDDLERNVMQKVAYEARELQRRLDLERAEMIANAVGRRLFGKG